MTALEEVTGHKLSGDGKNGSCQGYVFAGTFGLLLRQASLGVNFCARH